MNEKELNEKLTSDKVINGLVRDMDPKARAKLIAAAPQTLYGLKALYSVIVGPIADKISLLNLGLLPHLGMAHDIIAAADGTNMGKIPVGHSDCLKAVNSHEKLTKDREQLLRACNECLHLLDRWNDFGTDPESAKAHLKAVIQEAERKA